MEKEPCNWYMLKVAEEYGIQHTGEDVDEIFPLDLTGALHPDDRSLYMTEPAAQEEEADHRRPASPTIPTLVPFDAARSGSKGNSPSVMTLEQAFLEEEQGVLAHIDAETNDPDWTSPQPIDSTGRGSLFRRGSLPRGDSPLSLRSSSSNTKASRSSRVATGNRRDAEGLWSRNVPPLPAWTQFLPSLAQLGGSLSRLASWSTLSQEKPEAEQLQSEIDSQIESSADVDSEIEVAKAKREDRNRFVQATSGWGSGWGLGSRYCNHCDGVIGDGATFCVKCGQHIP
jgi:hypothetical protein